MISQARRYNLKLYGYEAAPDFDILDGGNGQGGEPANGPASSARKDIRSRALAIKYYTKWFSWCGEDAVTNYYAAKVSTDYTWPYALAENLDNTTNSPTLAGIKQVVSSPAPVLDGGHVIQ